MYRKAHIPVTFPLFSNYVLKTLQIEGKTIHIERFLNKFEDKENLTRIRY
jgi:hypothetical protein